MPRNGSSQQRTYNRRKLKALLEYNPDIHCGVRNRDGIPCTRVVTCHIHKMFEKEAVAGRHDTVRKVIKRYKLTSASNIASQLKGRAYDPDRHCGVTNWEGYPCMKVITCNTHLKAEKEKVEGRSKPLERLLERYKTSLATTIQKRKNPKFSALKDWKKKLNVQLFYNPDKNCGVKDSHDLPCLRVVACDLHTLAEKQEVPGRSTPVEDLIKRYKTIKLKERPKFSIPLNSGQVLYAPIKMILPKSSRKEPCCIYMEYNRLGHSAEAPKTASENLKDFAELPLPREKQEWKTTGQNLTLIFEQEANFQEPQLPVLTQSSQNPVLSYPVQYTDYTDHTTEVPESDDFNYLECTSELMETEFSSVIDITSAEEEPMPSTSQNVNQNSDNMLPLVPANGTVTESPEPYQMLMADSDFMESFVASLPSFYDSTTNFPDELTDPILPEDIKVFSCLPKSPVSDLTETLTLSNQQEQIQSFPSTSQEENELRQTSPRTDHHGGETTFQMSFEQWSLNLLNQKLQ